MDKVKLSTANIVILASGVVILIASFLPFNKLSYAGFSKSYSAWSSHLFLIATIPALLGVVMAVQVGIAGFASGVKLPDRVLGFTWTQIHLVLGFQTGRSDDGCNNYVVAQVCLPLNRGCPGPNSQRQPQ